MRSKYELERWLMKEILDRDIPRKPPQKARRTQNVRDEDYKAWIRTHPCAACGATYSVEAAHVGHDGGMSLKASDDLLLPLCTDCHTMAPGAYHRVPRAEFEDRTGLDCIARAVELRAAWRAETREGAA